MEKDIASLVLIGHQLSRADVQELEQELITTPDNFESRLTLIGYYYKHYYCCQESGMRRVDHIVWLIRKHADFKPILTSYLHVHLLDRKGYACIKAAWHSALTKHATSVPVYCNMASFVQFAEPEFAADLYERALQFSPGNSLVTGRLQKLRNSMELLLENHKSITSQGFDYFVPGAVVCPDADGKPKSKVLRPSP